MNKKHNKINILEAIWDVIVDWIELLTLLFGAGAIIVCLNVIIISLFLFPFVLLSNGFETFNLYGKYFTELWQNYQFVIVIIVFLAMVGIIRLIQIEAFEDLDKLWKEVTGTDNYRFNGEIEGRKFTMSYKNPIPHVDDERVSKQYSLVFTFETPVTKEEAMRGINELIEENGGTVPENWVKAGEPCGMKHVLP